MKTGFSSRKARSIIIESRGSHFDPEIVEAFMARENDFMAIAGKFSLRSGRDSG